MAFNGGLTQTAGSTILNGGDISSSSTINLNGGVLGGDGTVTASVANNFGSVAPGVSPGILTITGTYTQASTASLDIEIGGTTVGTQYDRLAVGGTATLDGTLWHRLVSEGGWSDKRFTAFLGELWVSVLTQPAPR